MKQISLANTGFEVSTKRTRKREFLDEMNRVVPWSELAALIDRLERVKVSIRAKVEYPFRVIKRQFGYTKVRYRGLAKNTAQQIKNTAQQSTLFALSNLWMVRQPLQGLRG